MLTISNLEGLRPYGLQVLTGEACALSRRLLFDVSPTGHALLRRVFGVQSLHLSEAWNGDGAIGSIMLDRETAMTASIMALLDNGAVEVWESTEGFLYGYSEAEMAEMDGDSFPICLEAGGRRYRLTPCGDRHQHVMSGRVG